jgi:hypothetical protein
MIYRSHCCFVSIIKVVRFASNLYLAQRILEIHKFSFEINRPYFQVNTFSSS